jgi:hypothetical protein
LTNEIIDLIVEETNKNAQNFLSKNRLTKSSRFSKWILTDQQEIKKIVRINDLDKVSSNAHFGRLL